MLIFVTVKWKKWINDDLNNQTNPGSINQRNLKIFSNLLITRTIMKNFIKGMTLLLAGISFMACSKDVAFDENAQKQAKAEAEIAQKYATYQSDFVKTFGSIASGHQWGFDQTTGRMTRTAVNSTAELWLIPDNFMGGNQNKEGWNANALEGDYSVSDYPQTLNGFDFTSFFLQHVEQPDGGNIKNGTQLQVYNSSTGDWEDVAHFSKGKSTTSFNLTGDYLDIETTYFTGGLNKSAACTTLMTNIGGAAYNNPNNANDPANGKLFRVDYGDGTYNYNYGLIGFTAYHKESGQWLPNEAFLAFEFPPKNKNASVSHWIIRLGEASKFEIPENPVLAEGRVFCEDMGANDFDFNDVVFDATIMKTGEINITVLAHGGILPIAVAGVDVTLGEMTNTGVNTAGTQTITISAADAAANGWTTVASIPVTVNPKDAFNGYDLKAPIGSAPQKICAPIGTYWPKEYINISEAYDPFTPWINMMDPAEWSSKMNPEKVYK